MNTTLFVDQLVKLAQLYRDDMLSADEFSRMKAVVISSVSASEASDTIETEICDDPTHSSHHIGVVVSADKKLTNSTLRALGDIPYRLIKYYAMSCPHVIPEYKEWTPPAPLDHWGWRGAPLHENFEVRPCHTLSVARTKSGKKIYRVNQNILQQLWALRLCNLKCGYNYRGSKRDNFGFRLDRLVEYDKGVRRLVHVPNIPKQDEDCQFWISTALKLHKYSNSKSNKGMIPKCDMKGIVMVNQIKGRSKLNTPKDYQQALLKL